MLGKSDTIPNVWKPCDKWTCDICREHKLFGELVPEILKALAAS